MNELYSLVASDIARLVCEVVVAVCLIMYFGGKIFADIIRAELKNEKE